MFEKAIGYIGNVELHYWIFVKYHNGGGLMQRVMVGRVGGQWKEYAIRVCISMDA